MTLRRVGWLSVAVVALALGGLAWWPLPAPERHGLLVERRPVLVVAVDGFEWNVVLPLLREGRLPHLRRIMESGSYGLLTTLTPTVSPALWTSIATGKSPEKHGIRSFLRTTKPPAFYSSADRRTKAYWNILSEHGRSVDVLGWWNTFPVEPINGFMVAQTNTKDVRRQAGIAKGGLVPGVAGQVHPGAREGEVFDVLEAMDDRSRELLVTILGQAPSTLPERVRHANASAHWSIRSDSVYAEMARRRLEGPGHPDLLAVYLGWTDVAGHHFWPLAKRTDVMGRIAAGPFGRVASRRASPENPLGRLLGPIADRTLWTTLEPPLQADWRGALARSYDHVDRVLGELLERQPTGGTTIVISDHGMRPWGHYDAPPAFLAATGANIRRRSGALPGRRSEVPVLGSILDITPTLLALSGLPVATDMDGIVLDAILEPAVPRRPRPDPIHTYDDAAWLASRSQPAEDGRAAADPERLEQLRALGYIE